MYTSKSYCKKPHIIINLLLPKNDVVEHFGIQYIGLVPESKIVQASKHQSADKQAIRFDE